MKKKISYLKYFSKPGHTLSGNPLKRSVPVLAEVVAADTQTIKAQRKILEFILRIC